MMANKDDKLEDEKLDDAVDGESQDETETNDETEEQQTDDAANESEDDSTNEDSEEEQSTDEETEEEKAEFEKRFPRFKGETTEEYLKNLEEGYANSSTEAVRLAKRVKELEAEGLSRIANDEDGEGKDSNPVTTAKDPALAWAEAEREKAWKQDWKDFAKLHPEVEQDETLFADFDKKTGEMFDFIQRTENRFPTLKEAMDKTWAYMNPDSLSKEEQIALKTKNAGAGAKSKGVTKDPPKPLFSDKQIETAKKYDPELRDKSRSEIEQILLKYSKK